MQKKLLAACLVIAAFAVVPSLASARPVLTHPTGTVLAAPATITATNVGNSTLVTSSGTLACTKDDLHGTLKANSTAGGIEAEITAATFGGTGSTAEGAPAPECTGSNFFTPSYTMTAGSFPWCLRAKSAGDAFSFSGGACGGVATAITFTLNITGVGTCNYSRSAEQPIPGTLVTEGEGTAETTSTGAISEVEFKLTSGPGLCWTSVKLTMRFLIETTNSEQIYISS